MAHACAATHTADTSACLCTGGFLVRGGILHQIDRNTEMARERKCDRVDEEAPSASNPGSMTGYVSLKFV
jgi:hypothetical protein